MGRAHSVVKAKEEVLGVTVKNTTKEALGEIEDLVLDKFTGQVSYVVLASGGFLSMGGKFFAIPWNAIKFDPQEHCFILNIDKEKLKAAPGFDKDHWPDLSDRKWAETLYQYYGTKPHWQETNR